MAQRASTRIQSPTGEASPSPLALQRLEQRLDSERRSAERQHKQLERRLEEFIGNCPQLGKLAELQGHVDGLNEAVQELAQHVHDGSATSRSQKPSHGDGQLAARVTGIDGRLSDLESRQAALEAASTKDSSLSVAGVGRSRQAKTCDDSCMQDLGPRTARLESLMESLGSWDASALDALQRQTATMSNQMADVIACSLPSGRGAPSTGSRDVASLREQLAIVQEDVARLTGRSQSVETQLRQFSTRAVSSELQAQNQVASDSQGLLEIKEQLEHMYRDLIGRVQDMEQRMSCAGPSCAEAPHLAQHSFTPQGEFDELIEHQAAEHQNAGHGVPSWPSAEAGPWPQGTEGVQDNLTHLCHEVANLASRLQEVETGAGLSRDVSQLAAECQNFAERLAEVEQGLEDVSAGRPWGQHDVGLEDQLGELGDQLSDLRADFDEQVGDLGARVHETERGLRDVAQAQDVQRQAHRVGERVLGLSLRMQRVEQRGASAGGSRSWAEGLGESTQECAELREELDAAGEALVVLRTRVQASEQSLEGVAEAIDRICEELAELRASRPPSLHAAVSEEDTRRLQTKLRHLELALEGSAGGDVDETDGQGLENPPEAEKPCSARAGADDSNGKLAAGEVHGPRNSASELRSRLLDFDGGDLGVVWALAEVVCDVARNRGRRLGAPAA